MTAGGAPKEAAALKKHQGLLLGAAVAALGPVILGGCPNESGRTAPSAPWRRYYSFETAEHLSSRASPGERHPWDVPEGTKPRAWKYIVIHHSATEEGSAAVFDDYHRDVKGWKGLAYHFVIGNGTLTPDGAVEVGYRWRNQTAGAHAGVREYNYHGIGVCLVGDFERSRPTERQMGSLTSLLGFLMKRFDIPLSRVVRHGDVVSTKCPGGNLPWPPLQSDEKPLEKRDEARKRLESR